MALEATSPVSHTPFLDLSKELAQQVRVKNEGWAKRSCQGTESGSQASSWKLPVSQSPRGSGKYVEHLGWNAIVGAISKAHPKPGVPSWAPLCGWELGEPCALRYFSACMCVFPQKHSCTIASSIVWGLCIPAHLARSPARLAAVSPGGFLLLILTALEKVLRDKEIECK